MSPRSIERDEVLRFARTNDHPDAEAVLIPDTALHTAGFLTELEATVGKTVLTANQVTMWEALRACKSFNAAVRPGTAYGPRGLTRNVTPEASRHGFQASPNFGRAVIYGTPCFQLRPK